MRELSEAIIDALLQPEGVLHPILTKVKRDHTLMLAIRDGFINIYYRGGSILRVTELPHDNYQTFFDKRYNKFNQPIPNTPAIIKSQADSWEWAEAFLILKNIMDEFLSVNWKPEREFQQLIARENNLSSVSNASEYFISDIEVNEPTSGARFDFVAIRWDAKKRRNSKHCRIALMELKYGDGALTGTAGLLKHLKDIDALISNKDRYYALVQVIENQFNQLDKLGLLNFNKGKDYTKLKLEANQKPEVVFILANHNPRASGLKAILNTPEFDAFCNSPRFDLKFYVASFAGYGLHTNCMLDLDKFKELL